MRCKTFAGTLIRRAMMTVVSVACAGIFPAAAPGQEAVRTMFGIAIRSSVLEKRFTRHRNEAKPISKVLMNTNVTGSQSTVTDTHLRIVPDEQRLRFDLLNLGDVTSQTTGINREALVDSVGNHHFEITKPFWFDGSIFLTLPAHGTIQASQTPQRVVSALGSSMPLLSPLSDRVAWNEVLRRQPEINRVVAEDVSRDVLPKIDRITDDDIARLGRQWKMIQQQTSAAFGRTTLQWAARSTDSVATVWAYADSSGGSRDSLLPVPEDVSRLGANEEIVIFVSENAVGRLLSQYFPAGLKLTDGQLQKLQLPAENGDADTPFSIGQLKQRLAEIAAADPAPAALFSLEFSPEKPVDVQFIKGVVRVTITFQIHSQPGASSGWMTTSFNLQGRRLANDRWTVAVRSVDVGSATDAASTNAVENEADAPAAFIIPSDEKGVEEADVTTVQAGTAWIPIVRAAATSLAEKIPPVRLPLEFDGSGTIPGAPRLRLSRIDSANGMLRVALRIVDAPQELSARK